MVKPSSRIAVTLLALTAAGSAAQEGNPHADAAECLADEARAETPACVSVCVVCHAEPDGPADMYDLGDRSICALCHVRAGDARPPERLLAYRDHGNHPIGVEYRRATIRSRLAPYPSGPKLFWDNTAGSPKVYCSTCHDPHGAVDRLLRVQPSRDFCLACHLK